MQMGTLGVTAEGAGKRFGSEQLTCKPGAHQDATSTTVDASRERAGRTRCEASPYSRFADGQLILRDELAIDRTLLANERTLLAYLRSGIALLIAGVSIIHFATHDWFLVVGFGCIPVGIITGVIGVLRYRAMDHSIGSLRKRVVLTGDPLRGPPAAHP